MKREVRSAAAPNVTGRKVSGMAVVFNSPSRPMIEEGRRFIEIIMPSAITDDLLQKSDVKALVDHNRERLLARWNKGRGTLTLRITSSGLFYEFEAPHTADGDYVVEMVGRGDIDGSSFAFSVGEDKWEKRKDGTYLRKITKINGLYDVTITASPAYPDTSVGVRNQQAKNKDYKEKLHKIARKAGIPFTPKEKINALRKEITK